MADELIFDEIFEQGMEEFDEGKYADAIQDYTIALDIDPGSRDAYFNRGLAYYSIEDDDSALDDFSSALKINPNDADALRWRGCCYKAKGEDDKALDDLTASLEIDSGNSEALLERSKIYAKQGLYKPAKTDCEYVLIFDPGNEVAEELLSIINGAAKEKEEKFLSAVKSGNEHFANEDFLDAISDYTEAIKLIEDEDIKSLFEKEGLDGMKKDLLYFRALSYIDTDNYKLANDDLFAALQIDTNFEDARTVWDSISGFDIDMEDILSEMSPESVRRKADEFYDKKVYGSAEGYYAFLGNRGDAWCQMRTGYMYYAGEGVEKDNKKAAMWFRRAAENGNTQAQAYLGVMYRDGVGVAKDLKKAGDWFNKAMLGGDKNAAKNLADLAKRTMGLGNT